MTATAHSTTAAGIGRVARVIGPVVDVEFTADQIPEIGNALLVETEVMGEKRTMTMETALHVGDNLIRAIALKPTDGMRRGAEISLGAQLVNPPRSCQQPRACDKALYRLRNRIERCFARLK